MTVTPRDLGLEYDAWRPGQWEAITHAVASPKSNVVIEAPTGAGKSVIALAIGRLLEAEKTMVLTGTKQLQEQYVGTSAEIREVRGRQNFVCLTTPAVMADDAPCTYGHKCPHKPRWETRRDQHGNEETVEVVIPGCAYYDQKRAARDAPEAVTNYAFALADVNYARFFAEPTILVADEAHTIEEQLRSFVTVVLRRKNLEELGAHWPRLTPDDWEGWRDWARQTHIHEEWGSATFKRAQAANQALHMLSQELDEDWLLRPTPRAEGMEFQPVWVSRLAGKYLLRHGKKRIYLSATVRPLAMFCAQLGLRPEATEFIELPSTFPVARRPLFYQPVGRVRRGDEQVLARLVERVDDILEAHPHEKGLIHTVSYDLRNYLMRHSRHGHRLDTHDAFDRTRVLERFKASAAPLALVSPSVGTGVDLPYELCRFNIICKLPFPNLGDEQVQRRMKAGPDGRPNAKGQSWFNWATMCALIQMYGRGMRAQDDACASYLLDGNWDWFKPAVRSMLPPWFLEAIRDERRSASRTVSIDDLLTTTPTPRSERILRI